MVGFDPKLLQVVSVDVGSFMSNGGAQTTLTKQVDAMAGSVLATVLRVGSAVSGQGPLLQITFKALAPADEAAIRVLSATPSPQEVGSAKLSDLTVKIK